MSRTLNLEIIPFIGLAVEEFTPEEKYEDLNNKEVNYHLTSRALSTQFDLVNNYKDLKRDSNFQDAREFINTKEFISDEKYAISCDQISEAMGISLTNKVNLLSNLNKVLNNNENTSEQFEYKSSTPKNKM